MSSATTPLPCPTRESCVASAITSLADGSFQQTLARRVAYRSESDGGAPPDLLAPYLADEMQPWLEARGFACSLHANPVATAGPLLVARRVEGADLPTVLLYGHGDVVSGQEARWRAGLEPWKLIVEGERWYGRGSADNKGQHSIAMASLDSVIAARGGALGYNVTWLLEMGEEAGSPGLDAFCAANAGALKADLFIGCDGPRVRADRPTVFLGSRGMVNFSLQLAPRKRGYHSGNWGGAISNPATRLVNAVSCLVDAQGRILVDALRPPPVGDDVKAALASLAFGGGADDPAFSDHWGEPGLTVGERLVGFNTLEVLALGAGSPQAPVNAIPPTAVAHCQLRFVVGTRWQELKPLVEAHLAAHGFADVSVAITMATAATRLDLSNPWVDWAANSIEQTTGVPTAVMPNLAGSLPNEVFSDTLGLPTLWIPHSYPACGQHGPDEHLLQPIVAQGLQMMAGVFWDLGDAPAALWRDGRTTG